jgi:large conductance mechanosensitive channel
MLKEFKEFIAKGNVIDLAVAVVIGAAFGAIVKAFTAGILMPLIGAFGDKPSFDDYTFTIGKSEILWGTVLTQIVTFLIIAFAMFLVVKAVNKMQSLGKKTVEEEEEEATAEVVLLQKIYDVLAEQQRSAS